MTWPAPTAACPMPPRQPLPRIWLLTDARNDAAAFVASDGAILGVELQAALSSLRATRESTAEDEMQLAKAILAYQPAD